MCDKRQFIYRNEFQIGIAVVGCKFDLMHYFGTLIFFCRWNPYKFVTASCEYNLDEIGGFRHTLKLKTSYFQHLSIGDIDITLYRVIEAYWSRPILTHFRKWMWLENTMKNGELAPEEQMLHFPWCFKTFLSDNSLL